MISGYPFKRSLKRAGVARVTVLVIAGILGVGTLLLVFAYITRPPKPGSLVPVVLAATDISPGTIVTPSIVRIETVPISDIQEAAASRLSEVNGKVTAAPLMRGDQIVTTTLVDKIDAFGLVAIIPPGTRAMTISVDSVDAVSGLLRPGDRVDVLASVAQGSDSVARTILQDVKLLAVNASLRAAVQTEVKANQTGPPAGAPPPPAQPQAVDVTIAVTPAEGERLVAAQYRGKLKLGLRGLGDNKRAVTAGASLNQVMGPGLTLPPPGTLPVVRVTPSSKKPSRAGLSAVAPALLPPLPGSIAVAPPAKTIRIIKGSQAQDVEVSQ